MIHFLLKREQLTDNELIKKFIESDMQEYFAELYLRYHHLVYLVCQKYLQNTLDSEDAVLEIFERLLSSIKNHNIKNFKGWLHIVTKNHCLMKIRAQKNVLVFNDPIVLDTMFEENIDISHHFNNPKEQYKDLEEAISQLKTVQKTCLELYYFVNKSYKEIASEVGIEVKHVKSHIQNGKRNLKNILSHTERILYE